jgi:hypothetical protein
MVRLLRGVFGSIEAYALQGYELVPIGPITGTIVFDGEVNSGSCSLGSATFGSRV